MTTIRTDTLPFLLSDVARMMQTMLERRIAEAGHDVTPGEARTLFFATVMDGAPQARLARRMMVDPMTVSDYVCRLEEAGLVARERDPSDRRVKRIVATGKAERLLTFLHDETERTKAAACRGLDGDETATLNRLLTTVRTNLCEMITNENCSA